MIWGNENFNQKNKKKYLRKYFLKHLRETHISNADSLDIDSGDHFLIYWLDIMRAKHRKKNGVFLKMKSGEIHYFNGV